MTTMYRVIFEHHVALNNEAIFIKKWKSSSDIIQKEPGALGSKLFKSPAKSKSDEVVLYIMADWTSKRARTTSIAAIKARGITIENHNELAIRTNMTEYELVEESLPIVK